MYKVYCLKEDNIVKYIGITSRSIKQRLREHINTSKTYQRNIRKSDWINQMILNKKEIVIEVLYETECLDDVNNKEIEYISLYGRETLLNNTSGGNSKCRLGESTKKILSEKMTGRYIGDKNPMYGKKRDDLINLNLSRPHEFYDNLSKSNADKFRILYNTPEYKQIHRLSQSNRKMIEQYDMEGNLIRIWDSLSQVENEDPSKKFYRKSVKLCLDGRYKKAHGFIWRWHI